MIETPNRPGYNLSRCKICGGKIRQWHTDPPSTSWFHETINADDEPFDIIDWWANRQKEHWGQPDGEPEIHPGEYHSADPDIESTWHLPCWNCEHVPGCAWVEDCGYAACPECFAD